jgi:hypothetical protein
MYNMDTQYECQILTSHIGVYLIPLHAWVSKERIMKIWCIVYMKLSHEFTEQIFLSTHFAELSGL